MKTFMEPLTELKDYKSIRENLKQQVTPIHISGCIDSQKCHLISGISKEYPYKLIITYSDSKAKEIYEDYKLYSKNVYLYPAKDVIFYSADIHGNTIVKNRLTAIRQLIEENDTTIITTIDAAFDRILPLDYIKKK